MLPYRVMFRRTLLAVATLLLTTQPGVAQSGSKRPPNLPGVRNPGTFQPPPVPQDRVNNYEWTTVTTTDQRKKIPMAMGTVYAPELNVPQEARKEYSEGMHAMAKGEYKTAEEHFKKAAELYPPYSSAFAALGDVYLKEKDTDGAYKAFQQALHLNPNNELALRNLGFLLANDGKLTEAERMLRTAVSVYPLDVESRVMMGYVELRLKHYDAVIATASQFSKSDKKNFPFIHLMSGIALEATGDYKQSAKEYREYLKKSNDLRGQSMAVRGLARLEKRQPHP